MTAGGSAISGWTITLTLADGTTIASLWNGKLSGSGTTVTVANESYNGSLAAGASTSFGFQASEQTTQSALGCCTVRENNEYAEDPRWRTMKKVTFTH